MKGIIGLVLIILGFVVMVWSNDRDNKLFWYDRPYTVLKRHQSEHMYKGTYRPDYYQEIRYDDDKNFTWTRKIDGSTYFSQEINSRYIAKDTTKLFDKIIWVCFALWLSGAMVLASHFTSFLVD